MLAACSGSQARNDWQPGISPGGKQEGAAGAHKTSATVIEDDQREDLGGYPVRYPACGQGRIAPSPAAGWGGLPVSGEMGRSPHIRRTNCAS
jgi:hypothetical protein